MKWAKKLSQFVQMLNETFPPEAEREPTIAEDYPKKWPEIQRKRLINKVIWIAIGIFLMLLIIARFWLGVAVINQFYQSIWPFGPIIAALALVILLYSTNKFECPRCRKIFQSYSGYDFLNDPKAHCQHCNLQIGGESKTNTVR